VLWKAFDVLDTFSQTRRVLTLSEISRRSGLSKSTVHRILTMLLEVKAVERVDAGYKIGIRMFTMGALSMDVSQRDVALPHLERLRRVTRQTVHLAVLQDDGYVVYLEKLPSPVSPRSPALVGGRFPAHLTGVGKALLAFGGRPVALDPGLAARATSTIGQYPDTLGNYLETVRRTGLAGEREEAAAGLACVAAPVLVGGRAVAAVSVAFAAGDGSGQLFANPLRETAAGLGRAMTAGALA
jgi:DNA-binding IclR family transcriptional regulator